MGGTAYAARNMSVPGAQNSSRMCRASQCTRSAPRFCFTQEASLGLQQLSACSQAIFLVDQRGDLGGTAYAARNMSVPGAQNSSRMCRASQCTRGAPRFCFAQEASLGLQQLSACSQAIFLVDQRGDLGGTAYAARNMSVPGAQNSSRMCRASQCTRGAPRFCFAQEASLGLQPISACSQAIFLVDQRGDLGGTAYAARNMSVPGAQNSSRMCRASQGTRGAPRFCFAQEASLGLQPISACSQAIFLVDQKGDLGGTAYAARNMSVPGAQNSSRMCRASQGTRGARRFCFAQEASLGLQPISACSQAMFLVDQRGDLGGTAYVAR